MKPIYFPYTYISNQVAGAVAACFGRFMIYQPLADRLPPTMRSWVEKGVIEIRIPFDPLAQSKAYNKLKTYIEDIMPIDVDMKIGKWLMEVQKECNRLNPGRNCKAAFDPEPSFEPESGDGGWGAKPVLIYRLKLKEEIKGTCELDND